MWNLKIQQTCEYSKKETDSIEDKLVAPSRGKEGGWDKIRGGEWQVQATGCKIDYKDVLYG